MNHTTHPNSTPAQQAVIDAKARNVACIAGPGSGKTKTLVDRILADIARGKRPAHLAAITFTQNAAREMRERLAARGAPELGYIGTLHGFCLELIRTEGPVAVLDAERAEMLGKMVLEEIRSKVSAAKLKEAVAGLVPVTDEKVKLARNAYLARLTRANAVDYDTILVRARNMLHAGVQWKKWDCIYVDEYQDSGPLDAEIYDLLDADSRFFVGDPDQGIYGFRGARLANIMELAGGHDTFVGYLEANFRSCPAVCDAATRLIARNRNRLPKATVAATPKAGTVSLLNGAPFDSEVTELAALVHHVKFLVGQGAQDSTAILCRYNATRQIVLDALKGEGVKVKDREPDEPKDWKATLLTLSLLCDPTNQLTVFFWAQARFGKDAAARMVRELAAGSQPHLGLKFMPYNGPVDLARILSQAGHEKGSIARVMDAAEALGSYHPARLLIALQEGLARKGEVQQEGVSVLTMHGAKGLEFDHVLIPALEGEDMPGINTGDLPTVEEARRLFFVAVTRARHTLTLSWARTRRNAFTKKVEPRTPSPFIAEL
jgi:DNA helicase-2/ATP-dependent DNA helicase PcrA